MSTFKLKQGSFFSLLALLALASWTPSAAAAAPNCDNWSNSTLVSFPAVNPVWEMCVRRPNLSRPTPNGSGVEIFEVMYNGHLVMERGNVPVLNVQYGTGGCGCFRDWMDSEVRFDADTTSCQGDGVCDVLEEPITICDCAPGNTCDDNPNNACNVDVGSYQGVAVKRGVTSMSITSHARAGWYRYTMIWVFHLDGTIEPQFKFGATPNGCTDASHNHLGYYRFDFDIAGADGDLVESVGTALSGIDTDGDSVDDTIDNCIDTANDSQVDTDGDGFGNACDADFNNDGTTNFIDLNLLSDAFLGTDLLFDLNGDGSVNFLDIALFGDMFLTPPGPAGSGQSSTPILSEMSDFADDGETWTVTDTATGRGYRVIPGSADLGLSSEGGIPNPEGFAVADYWVLNQNASEIDDEGGGCATSLNNYVNGESTDDTDIVFWLRFGTYHKGLDECFCGTNGPRLEPFGDWSPASD
ncbi:MAG: thrombospondin type 3 repeat-containing protein [Gammaproteobacteria bacterium]